MSLIHETLDTIPAKSHSSRYHPLFRRSPLEYAQDTVDKSMRGQSKITAFLKRVTNDEVLLALFWGFFSMLTRALRRMHT